MRLSDAQLAIQRERDTQTQLDLFLFKPRVVLQCQINDGAITKGARTINYDTVSVGNFSAVEAGMTLLVGTVAGGNDVGKIRIKSATSLQFVVSENSNIKWQDNLFLTVLRYWDIWPVFPRIIQNPSNPEDVIFYKDYDILYSGQNFKLGTFVNAGPHRPVFLENGTGTAYYSSTGTFNLLGNSLSYDWSFEGGIPTGSTLPDPGNVAYNTAGDYVTRLIVTDNATGIQDKTYRYVSVRNKIGEGSNTPIVKWTMGSLSGSRDEGGYTAEFKVYDPDVQIDEHSVVMLRATDWYGSNKISLGGNYPESSYIFFVGYVEQGSIRYNAKFSYTSFTVQSITGIMKRVTGFSVSVESSSNPSFWYQLRDMDVRRAVYHYLKWHSTVLSVSDFSFMGTDYKIQYFDVDRTSVFDAVDEVMKSALYGRLSADRQGRLWAEVDPLAYSNPTGTFTPVMNITKQDWMNEPNLGERLIDDLSYAEYGGIAYSGASTGTFAAILAGAPGSAPSFAGGVEKRQGFALGGQIHLNQLVGNVHANKSALNRFPNISMDMSNQTRNLDIAPQEVVSVKINSEDTVRREVIDKLYIPNQFSWEYNAKTQRLSVNVSYLGLVSGNPGDTILIPPAVEDADYQFPNFSFPPIPELILPTLPIVDPIETTSLVIHVKGKGIFYTNDLTSESPSWYSANVNLIGYAQADNFRNFEVSASGEVFIQIAGTYLYAAPYPGSPWSEVFSILEIDNPQDFPFPRDQSISGFGINRSTGQILLIAGLIVTITSDNVIYPWIGDSSGLVRSSDTYLFIPSGADRYGYITHGNNDWVYIFSNSVNVQSAILEEDGYPYVSIVTMSGSTTSDSLVSTRAGRANGAIIAKDGDIRLSIDDGVSYSRITGSPVPFGEGFSVDRFESVMANEDGTVLLVASSSPFGIAYSLNGGASWNSGTGSFFGGDATCVWNIGDDTWAFSGDDAIYVVNGYANTGTFNKTGNLSNLITGTFEVIAMRHY